MSTFDYLVGKYDRATITAGDLAHESNRSATHIRRLCNSGEIKAAKVGHGRWVIPIAAAAAFLDGDYDDAT